MSKQKCTYGTKINNVDSILVEKHSVMTGDVCNHFNDEDKQFLVKHLDAKDIEIQKDFLETFRQHALNNGKKVAILFNEKSITYGELDKASNKFAHYLLKMGIGCQDVLGVLLPRGIDFIIAVLAVLKVRATYLPLDPTYPMKRLEFLLKNGKVKYLIASDNTKELCQSEAINLLNISNINVSQYEDIYPDLPYKNEDIAYIIYTSGSSGAPKGVKISYNNVNHYVFALSQRLPLSVNDLYLHTASFAFSSSIRQMLIPLANGLTIVLADEEQRKSPEAFVALVSKYKITITDLIPSFFGALCVWINSQNIKNIHTNLESLRLMLFASELLSSQTLVNWKDILPDLQTIIINMYGQTETTGIITTYECDSNKNIHSKYVPIGLPIAGTRLRIVNEENRLVPNDVLGELIVIAGAVSSGYCDDERALQIIEDFYDPLTLKHYKAYRTGDVARLSSMGVLELLGRQDHQIKIRGFRVELGEIENTLLNIDDIKQSVVVCREDIPGQKRLVAYVVFTDVSIDKTKCLETVTKLCKSQLPDYMQLSQIVVLDEIPLTLNGKIDRQSLPIPEKSACLVDYEAPTGGLEVQIAKIWSELLHVDKICRNDNFFQLGGHSLLAIQATAVIRTTMNVDVPLSALLEFPRLKSFAETITNKYIQHQKPSPLILDTARTDKLPLSFAQERLWFIEQYEEGSSAYNTSLILKMKNDQDLLFAEQSIRSIVLRHEILRTVIKTSEDGQGYQEVLDLDVYPLKITRKMVSNRADLETSLEVDVNHRYDLSCEYPIRVCLYEFNNNYYDELNYYIISIVIHHIAFDRWSADIFLKELEYYYTAQKHGLENLLPLVELPIQYKDFALWQKNYLNEVMSKQLGYWKAKLNGYETLNLPIDNSRPLQIDYRGNSIDFTIDVKTSNKLRDLAKELKVSLYTVLLAGYYLLLKSYSSQDDIVIGAPVSNRHYPQIENVIGFFVNTLILRQQIESNMTITNFIQQVGIEVIQVQLNQDVPFERLVEELAEEKDQSRHPIFQIIFETNNSNESAKADNSTNQAKSIFEHYESKADIYNVARFDLRGFIDASHESLCGNFTYALSLFKQETVQGFISTYINILQQFSKLSQDRESQSKFTVQHINYLSADAHNQISSWNITDKDYIKNKNILQLFEEQVEQTPDSIAVVYESISLTYKELNERVNKLGHFLRSLGVGPDILVAIAVVRSMEMIIGILGILKSGGAYVPLDVNAPEARLKYIRDDIKASIVLTNEISVEKISSIFGKIISIDGDWESISKFTSSNPLLLSNPSHLAYVIYTSGTTGNPKGVMIEHAGVTNLVLAQSELFGLSNSEMSKHCLWYSAYVFDAHVSEIFTGLLWGHVLYIINDPARKNLATLDAYIEQRNVNIATIPPALLNTTELLKLDTLIVAGDKTSEEILESYRKNNAKIINAYGPSEITVCASLNYYNKNGSTNIGSPIYNACCYVLSTNLTQLPIGAIGELYISGVGLARGYLNQPGLTMERFIANPFQTSADRMRNKNSRLYKTGDLVRYLPNGDIEYIGRNDFQVKIRGFRIELGEIETALTTYPNIKQSIVLVRKNANEKNINTDNKYLVGYYVSEEALDTIQIISYLEKILLEYMVPNIFVHLKAIPLTVNGKLDRNALPIPKFIDEANYVAPRTELEAKIVDIWTEVLGLDEERIGVRDDFFRLGGHSILAIKLISKLNLKLGLKLSVALLFKASTIEKLILNLLHDDENVAVIQKIKISNPSEQKLSFAQERLWFIDEYEGGSNSYNIPLILRLPHMSDIDLIQISIKRIVIRHEVLRTLIKTSENGASYQEVLDLNVQPLDIKHHVVNNVELDKMLENDANYIYNLSREYPIKICIYKVDSNDVAEKNSDYILSIIIHHIAFDGWSADIFLKELKDNYLALKQGLEGSTTLAELSIQYKDFALWQRNYLTGTVLSKQIEYWKTKLNGYETLNLPIDKTRPQLIDYRGMSINFALDVNVSNNLRALAKKLKVSLYTVLLSGYYLLMRSYSNQDEIVIGTPLANRHYSQIENLIGFFVNMLVLRQKIDSNKLLVDFIEQVGTEVIELQLHQDLPFDRLVGELGVEKDQSRHPIFQIVFDTNTFNDNVAMSDNVHHLNEVFDRYNSDKGIYNIARYDLRCFIDVSREALYGSFNYSISLFAPETIQGFINTYINILQQFSTLATDAQLQGKMRVKDINYLDVVDYQKIANGRNSSSFYYPKEDNILKALEEQVSNTPDRIAIVYENMNLSYNELNERSNILANFLRCKGVGPDVLVAVAADRSMEMVIGLLGILKAGGAYIPVDVNDLSNRFQYILEDSQTSIVLTNERSSHKIPAIFEHIVSIDGDWSLISEHSSSNPILLNNPNNLAYVIYTSGTTGNPKGVMISHSGMMNLIVAQGEIFNLYNQVEVKHCLWYASYVFDAHVSEFFTSLINGHVTYLVDEQIRKDIELLGKYIEHNRIHIATIPPAILSSKNLLKLDTLVVAGDKTPEAILNYYTNNDVKVINAYGPSEITVCASANKYNKNGAANIGSPIHNTKCYVINDELTLVPIGAIGELYIGGVGLARGYLNRPGLTAERFIANPFQTKEERLQNKNSRLYKTGDLVRYSVDGNIEYIGRNDFQVKIRGFRIELGEIEAALSSYPEIKQSVVLARSRKDVDGVTESKYLVGYYVAPNKLNSEQIFNYLEQKLPEYMIPSNLVYLESMPLTVNGKLDGGALPAPEFTNQDTYVEPRNELENSVRHIWAEVLQIDDSKAGIRDDFFRLGGDSIISIQLVSRLRQRLSLNVSVKDIFSYKTIERLYDNVISKGILNNSELKSEQGILSGELGLLPIQKWFFDNTYVDINHYNQAFIIKTSKLDIERLKISLIKLIDHHDAFRLRYKKPELESDVCHSQYYISSIQMKELKVLDISELKNKEGSSEFTAELQDILTLWQSNFNIEEGPAYSIGYLHGYADGGARVWFAQHHLLIDSVSWRIIAEDLREVYEGKELGVKGSSYRQWVTAIENYALKNKEEQSYWLNVLSGYDAKLFSNMIIDKASPNYATIELDSKQTELLLTKANATYNTHINDLLITAFSYALQEITGQTINYITLEGHGREEIDPNIDINATVGWFTSMYPVRTELHNELGSSIKYVKETLRQIPNKGIGYGSIIGYKNDELPGIYFNYLGQFDTKENINNWTIVSENSGRTISSENNSPGIICVNGLTINGKLHFNISSKLDDESTKRLAQAFTDRLIEVINHTTNQSRTYLTPSDIDNIINQKYLDKLQLDKQIEGVYLANSLQQGFVYHSLSQGDIDDAYLVQNIWEYHAHIDVDKLKEAWRCAQQKYPSLRLRFNWQEEIVQVIDKESTLDWRYIDLIDNAEDTEQLITQIQQDDRKETYNLEVGSLFRVYIIKQQNNLYTCIFSSHHAILDGWSNPVLLNYVHETYLSLLNGRDIIASIDNSYTDAQKYTQEQRFEHKIYWDDYLGDVQSKCDFSSLMHDNLKIKSINLGEYRNIKNVQEEHLVIEGDLYLKLKALCQEQGITLNGVLQFTLHRILSFYRNSEYTVVGTTVSGRNLPVDDVEGSVGLYINTLPLIINHEAQNGLRIIEAIIKLQDNINEINTRSIVELATLQKGGERLFDVLSVFENYPTSTIDPERDSKLSIKFNRGVEKLDYPLQFKAFESTGKLSCVLSYESELFNEIAIQQLLISARMLLEQVVDNPHQTVRNLSSISAAQYRQIIYSWNETNKDYPEKNQTIQSLFEEQVARTPDKIAIVYGDINLTYKELNGRANKLANYLRKYCQITPDTLVAVCLDRSEQMLIAIIGILKSGGAYVPLDPSYPDTRIEYAFRDTGAKIVLTNSIYADRLEALSLKSSIREILSIDSADLQSKLLHVSCNNPDTATDGDNLAYVIYTSGTTGNPKGVMVAHKAVVNRIIWMNAKYPLSLNDKILHKTPFTFDVSVWELLWANWYGASIVIAKDKSHKDASFILNLISKHQISICHFVPAALDSFITIIKETSTKNKIDLSSLDKMFCSGEALKLQTVNDIKHIQQKINVHNLYGPTEAAIDVLYYDCNAKDNVQIYIGKPIDNIKSYILDSALNPVPIGAIGELYVGGVGLARGYLNQPRLTAEKFIANSFQTNAEKLQNQNTRLYKTGDLARYVEDGNVEYIGRNDSQVKIRGFRVELGEIETAINSYEGIIQSVVVALESTNIGGDTLKYLVAYYAAQQKINENNIYAYLDQILPQYMIPNKLVYMAALPLTLNGKLNRAALPVPEFINDDTYVGPRNELESSVRRIWAEILGLEEDKISIEDNFFRLGGSSIIAIKLASKLASRLGLTVSVAMLFKANSIRKLVHSLLHDNEEAEDTTIIQKSSFSESREQSLSFSQERLWFIDKYEEGSNAYNIPLIFKLSIDCDLILLQRSLKTIIARHDILRTVIKIDGNGRAYQEILQLDIHPLEIHRKLVHSKASLEEDLKLDINHLYDLSAEYPIKMAIYELNAEENHDYYLSIVVHHIAFDGWSTGVFLKELGQYYKAYQAERQAVSQELCYTELPIQYKDFAFWQRQYLTGDVLTRQLRYWQLKLNDHESLNLLTDKVRPLQTNYAGGDIYFELGMDVSKELRNLAKDLGVSLYSVLLAGFYIMLRAYSNQDDIVIGTPVANRHYPQIETLIGFFVNTLVLRQKISRKALVIDFIQDVGREVIEAQLHQDLPFEKLVDELNVAKDTSRHPIFQVMFGMNNVSKESGEKEWTKQLADIFDDYTHEQGLYSVAKFDLTGFVDASSEELRGSFNYATSLFNAGTIEKFIDTYIKILQQFSKLAYSKVAQQKTLVQELDYLSAEAYQRIIYTWNATENDYPKDKTIQQLFEEQVERTPDRIAVVYEEISLTYKALNDHANRLANYLTKNHKVKSGTLVALCLDRSEQMLISVIGVLKSGAAYVPIDPTYPKERIAFVLEDTQTKVVISNNLHQEKLESLSPEETMRVILSIDSEDVQLNILKMSCNNPTTATVSENLANVIYTSGTTGKPKGVMVSHKALINRINWMNAKYPLSLNDKILHKTQFTFDVSVWELLWANWYGAPIVMAKDKAHKDASYILDLILKYQITVCHFVPTALDSFLTVVNEISAKNKIDLSSLDKMFCSGEALKLQSVNDIKNLQQKINIHNLYGPTEAAIDVLYYDCNAKDIEHVYIGKPIDNIKSYILGATLHPLPIGAIGELYIGGVGLARGYLNRAGLTAERFIANPFQTKEERLQNINSRLYKTGDLVRYSVDGNIEYIGRNDFQVKIRGFRIELGEIEAALSSYPEIKQSVVLARIRKDVDGITESQYLVGYYVAESKLNSEQIFNHLEQKLPEYMIPSNLVYLESMPLTINGKLDGGALPAPEFTNQDTYVEPRNELENSVRQIWAEVLQIDELKAGIRDDFFRLGGDSIISIQLVSRLRQRLSLSVSVKDIFSYKTIERLYDNVISKGILNNSELKSEQGIISGELGLLPIQKWFFDNTYVDINHYNQAFIIKTSALDIEKLKTSLGKLIEHHDAFRLRYKMAELEGDVCHSQYYTSLVQMKALKTLDISELKNKEGSSESAAELQDILTLWQSNFNIEDGPAYSIGYLYGYADGGARVWFALHHLLIDSVSWRIIAEDLREIYEGKELGVKGSSYRQWVTAIESYALKNKEEQSYWLNVLSDYDAKSFSKMIVDKASTNYAAIELDNKQTELLLTKANAAYNTHINDLLITAFSYALQEITGQPINHITLEGHGREEIDPSIDINRTVGWFTSMYPVRTELQNELGSSIKYIKETLRQIPNKGIGYGAILGYEYAELPGIYFNYLGQFDTKENINSWNIVAENSGRTISSENNSPGIISVNGLTINGKLHFNISSKLDDGSTKQLAQAFVASLVDIINHTANQSRTYLTPSDIDNIINQEYLDKLQLEKEIVGVYLANSLQQGFVYHALNQGAIDDAYLVQNIWEYHTHIDVDKLKEAWRCAQQKYPSLRLRFNWQEEIVQILDKEGILDWRYIDLGEELIDEEQQWLKIKQIQAQDRLESYNLVLGNLFRVYIIKRRSDLYTCIFSNHHAILDGWSNQILLDYIHKTYLNLLQGALVCLSIDHSYSAVQKYVQEHRFDNKDYWSKYISQLENRVDFSGLMHDNFKIKNINLAEHRYIVNPKEENLIIRDDLYINLKALGQDEGVTLNGLLQYSFHKVLKTYGNSQHTVVGTITSGRNLPMDDIEQSVGLYINTLPLIVDHKVPIGSTLIGEIRNLQTNLNDINARSIVELASLRKDGARLFDVLFIYENYPTSNHNKELVDELGIGFKGATEKLDYPLCLIAFERNNQLVCSLKYAGELFSQEAISNLLATVNEILEQIVANPNQRTNELEYLPAEQYKQIIYAWNDSNKDYPKNKTIQCLFEEQVARTPNRVAIVYGDISLTYQELNERSNMLAHYLMDTHGIGPDSLVVICLDRTEQILIAILAILKAGGAYVPIDPTYPDERIAYILEDTAAVVVITNKIYAEKLQFIDDKLKTRSVLSIDDAKLQVALSCMPICNPKATATSNHLAYVIYTSGTTGRPKGVMIEHKAYVATIDCINHIHFSNKQKISTYSVTSYVFDIFGLEYGLTLLSGGALIIGNNSFSNLDCANLDFIQITPSLCDLKLEELQNASHLKLLVGGEALRHDLLLKILNKPIDAINMYGPTETTIWSTSKSYSYNEHTDLFSVSLGRPLSNEITFVLDSTLAPLPIGAIGELYIGGLGLARGYLNNPALTADKFIANPFQTFEERRQNKNARLYKTGDLVRYLPDGDIEYIGRNDFQVKLRGFRIELGEIEAALTSYPTIKQSVVLARKNTNEKNTNADNKYLVGYYVSEETLNASQIISYLEKILPEYMVPNIFVHLKAIPLTINGKLDRDALPAPEFIEKENYVPPRTELENKILDIWTEVLDLKGVNVGIEDDFFKFGGNSIAGVKLASALRQRFAINVNVHDIFIFKTIKKLYDYISSEKVIESLEGDAKTQPYIIVNKHKQQKLFVFPPGFGGAESYLNNIAKKITEKRLILFNNYFLDLANKLGKETAASLSFESLAKMYICHIKALQPQGPYNFFGWSFGGVLAFEVSKQLIENNDRVDNLVLLDSFFSYSKAMRYIGRSTDQEAQINYLYNPKISEHFNGTRITMIKAQEPVGVVNDIYKYYSSNTKYNHLDDYIASTSINVIKIHKDHNEWVNDETAIKIIAGELIKF